MIIKYTLLALFVTLAGCASSSSWSPLPGWAGNEEFYGSPDGQDNSNEPSEPSEPCDCAPDKNDHSYD